MTFGALIFAQNNSSIDYTKLAIFSAKQIIKHLDIPVTLVTDNADWLSSNYAEDAEIFDKVLVIDGTNSAQTKKFHDGTLSSHKYEWKNYTRSQVFDLTPYDKTLVVDSDFIVNSSLLKNAFNSKSDFQIYRSSTDLANWRNTSSFDRINQYSIPFYWATVFIFEKNSVTESFFKLVAHIKENWNYYRLLYSIDASTFRNDFAFSIALHIMNGSSGNLAEFGTELPGTMTYITDRDFIVSTNDNKMQFLVEKENYRGEYTLVKTTGLDVHVMNKHSLIRLIDGGSGV